MNKKGLSTIVVTLILIVLSLVAVGVVWVVVSNLLNTGTQQANFQFGTLFLDLKISKVAVDINGNLSLAVQRGAGQGDLTGIAFIISDGTNSQVVKKDSTMQELGSTTFTLTPSDLGSLGVIKDVSIAPILTGGQVGQKSDETTNIIQNALSFTTTHSGSGNLYTYWLIYSGSYPIISGDYLEYDVYCDISNSVCDGGMEIEGTGWNGRGLGLTDQNSLNNVYSGSGDYSSKKGQWYHRKVSLTSAVGKTILMVSPDEESDLNTNYHYYYRNVVITNAGAIKNIFYNGGQPQSNRLNYGSGNTNSGVVPYN